MHARHPAVGEYAVRDRIVSADQYGAAVEHARERRVLLREMSDL
jgi:hypothetical protein